MDTFKNILKWVVWASLFAVPFIPLIVVNDMFFPYITGKNFLFRFLIEVAFGSWLALALIDKTYRPKRSWLLGAFALFAVVISIADITGVNPEKSIWSNYERMEGLVTILHLFGFFIVLGSALSEKIWHRLVFTSFFVASVIGLIGFNQLANGVGRIDATLGNSTYLGGYLLVHIFLVLYFILRRIHISWRTLEDKTTVVFYGILGIYFTCAMYFTGTRGSILGFIGGLCVTALIVALFEREHSGLRKSAIGLLAGVLLLVVALGVVRGTDFAKQHPMIDRFSAFVTVSPSELKNYLQTAGFARTTLWNMAWQGVKERPLLGWGQDNFSSVFAKYYNPKMYTQEQWFDRTHNVFFDWLIAGGFLGLISYLAIFVAAVWIMWRKRDVFSITERAVFAGLITAYFIHNFFVFDNLTSYILIAIVLSFVHIKSSQEIPLLQKDIEESARGVGATVLLALTMWAVFAINGPAYSANKDVLLALAYTSQAQPTQAASDAVMKQFQAALAQNSFGNKEIREQLILSAPRFMVQELSNETRTAWYNFVLSETRTQFNEDHDSRTLILLGGFYGQLGAYDNALSAFQDANTLFPNKPSTYLSIAGLYNAKKDFASAEETLRKVLELVPDFGTARAALARVLIDAGKFEEAKKVISENATSTYMTGDADLIQKLSDKGEWGIVADMLKVYVDSHSSSASYEMHVSLVTAYLKLGKKDQALGELDIISTRFPDKATTTSFQIEGVKNNTFILK